jgi:hypothetical protein
VAAQKGERPDADRATTVAFNLVAKLMRPQEYKKEKQRKHLFFTSKQFANCYRLRTQICGAM